jgi:hypothetical protein
MIKVLEFYPEDPAVEIKVIHPGVMEKTAEYDPELIEYVHDLKPKEGSYFLLVNALGAGEYYGSNRNGDYFPEDALEKYYKTFETIANVYKHHKNKPNRGHKVYGEILYAHYNTRMHRVELVIELDVDSAPDLKLRIDKGEYPPVSMGARVPFDVCNICGNKSKSRAEYCERAKFKMNRILPNGQKVYVINTQPKFFDLSFVLIPADRTAGMMAKVASTEVRSSAELGEEYAKQAEIKEADIVKKFVGQTMEAAKDPKKLILDSQPNMPPELLETLSKRPLPRVFSTLIGLRIMPKKEEFQKIVLSSLGAEQLAEELEREKVAFVVRKDETPKIPEDVNLENFSDEIYGEIAKHADYLRRAPLTKPIVLTRVIEKYAQIDSTHLTGSSMEQAGDIPIKPVTADNPMNPSIHQVGNPIEQSGKAIKSRVKNPIVALSLLGSLYYGLAKLFNVAGQASKIQKLVIQKPWLLPILVGGASLGTVSLQKNLMEKQSSLTNPFLNTMLAVPITYFYSGMTEAKARRGEEIGKISDFIRKHPLLSSLGLGLTAGPAIKAFKKLGSIDEKILTTMANLSPKKFDELYHSVIL